MHVPSETLRHLDKVESDLRKVELRLSVQFETINLLRLQALADAKQECVALNLHNVLQMKFVRSLSTPVTAQ